jgi:hypothetical protein
MRRVLFALVVGIAGTQAGEARAQIVPGPNGSIVLSNPGGTYTVIHPTALVPHAVVPGSLRPVPGGLVYLGTDGRGHGAVRDPFGNLHVADYAAGAGPRGGASAPNSERPWSGNRGNSLPRSIQPYYRPQTTQPYYRPGSAPPWRR